MSEAGLLEINLKVLRVLNLWPSQKATTKGAWRTLKDLFLIIYVFPSFLAVTVELGIDLYEGNHDISSITESLIAITCCVGMFYVIVCFLENRDDIMKLVEELGDFQKFGTPPDLMETDRKASIFTLCFIVYGMVGILIYSAVPFITIQDCEENKSQIMRDRGIPCGLVITKFYLPFKFDFTPRKEIVTAYQVTICTTFTTAVSALTLLLCGMLMHISTQLRYLGSILENLSQVPMERVEETVRECLQYHVAIIIYATKTNSAFSSMMMLHITVTSFVVSILGYQVLLTDSYTDSLRYGLHLGGWLVILFLVCYNGQTLIDESTAIAKNAYFASWYCYAPTVQRDVLMMILRAQKPLPLTALNFGVMSLATYLQVMSTAYSYFTLLLKMKSSA